MVCIGIDQSYKRTGFAISKNDKVKYSDSITFEGSNTNTERRRILSKYIVDTLNKNIARGRIDPSDTMIIIERIRLRSQGFLNVDYIKSTAALIAVVVDIGHDLGIPVYSVDTRSWKSQIVGTSKGHKKQVMITRGKNKGKMKTVTDNKQETLDFVRKVLYIDCGEDDDKADAICISKYGFLPKSQRKLKLEV